MSRKWLRFIPAVFVVLLVGALVWRIVNPPDTNVESGMEFFKLPTNRVVELGSQLEI